MRRCSVSFLFTVVLLSGCGSQNQPETAMYHGFSLASVVERMNVPELKPMSGDAGGSESPGEKTRRRRDFHLLYKVEESAGTRFDDSNFIILLKVEVERVMLESGVRLEGGGSYDDGFHFDYSKEGHEGWLEVVGARVEGDRLKLWGLLRENAEKETK